MFEIRRYNATLADEWNTFVAHSKNGTFLFDRRYMDYHSDRFKDHSLLAYLDGRLYAILPANEDGERWVSHAGLTYGGLIMDEKVTVALTLQLFKELNEYLRTQGFRQVLYKCIPWIYHAMPAEEDLYAIFRTCNARLAARDIGTTIPQDHTIRWERVRRRAAKRAHEAGVCVRRGQDFAAFWKILDDNLMTRYGVHPVHTLQEIELLHSRFPEDILLYEACLDGKTIAGLVLYRHQNVVHAQYSSATPEGKRLGAMDILYEQVICKDFSHVRYFDFGRSTENRGLYLNEDLIFQKEGFGGRGLCWDWYEWDLEDGGG